MFSLNWEEQQRLQRQIVLHSVLTEGTYVNTFLLAHLSHYIRNTSHLNMVKKGPLAQKSGTFKQQSRRYKGRAVMKNTKLF